MQSTYESTYYLKEVFDLKELHECIDKALEKQIPKKPKKYVDLYGDTRNGCPACPRNEILYAGQQYCSVCGQAIDWSE